MTFWMSFYTAVGSVSLIARRNKRSVYSGWFSDNENRDMSLMSTRGFSFELFRIVRMLISNPSVNEYIIY